jgi:hypothetical protein
MRRCPDIFVDVLNPVLISIISDMILKNIDKFDFNRY